jgi:hypothetical protein
VTSIRDARECITRHPDAGTRIKNGSGSHGQLGTPA